MVQYFGALRIKFDLTFPDHPIEFCSEFFSLDKSGPDIITILGFRLCFYSAIKKNHNIR